MAKLNPSDGLKVDIESLKKAIRALESPKAKRDRERAALFAVLYPDIRDKLNNGVSKNSFIKALAEHGMSISNALFDELLEAEAQRRGESVPGKDDEAGDGVTVVPDNVPPQAPQAGAKEEVSK